jgi:glycosyltransferase involved in cell wall biosynthesis
VGRAFFIYPTVNEKLRSELLAIGVAEEDLVPVPFVKRRGEPYWAPLRFAYRRQVRRVLHEYRANVAVLVQGRIECLSAPAIACSGDVRVVSYIPMAHSVREIRGDHLLSALSDLVRRPYYGIPSHFIVPSASAKAQLLRNGAKAPITVVPNVAPLRPLPSRETARIAFGLSQSGCVASLLGRLEMVQKGLDLFVQAAARSVPRPDWTFLVVGDGPDAAKLKDLARELAVDDLFRFVRWTDRPEAVLAASDLFVMPSRHEGVPLVMLEALSHGIPILGSQIDVFQEYLPDACRTDFATTGSLARDLERAFLAPNIVRPHCANIQSDPAGSSQLFLKAIASTLSPETNGAAIELLASDVEHPSANLRRTTEDQASRPGGLPGSQPPMTLR